jgi:hypothetical protein
MRAIDMTLAGLAAATLLGAAAPGAHAQRPTRRGARTTTIEIRGQVPTPQVTTIRPREAPTFSRQVLVPNFYDRNFWPSILLGYGVVALREVTGVSPSDTAAPMPVAVTAPGVGTAQSRPVLPAIGAEAASAAPAPTAATRDEEIRAIRRELELRRARLDSLLSKERIPLDSAEARARRRIGAPAPTDTTRRPPPGTAPAR